MSLVAPGVCRHCGCTESNPCRLQDGDTCFWDNRERTVCSNPSCRRAEGERMARAKAAAKAARPRKLTSAEVHELIRSRGRSRKKGRAA